MPTLWTELLSSVKVLRSSAVQVLILSLDTGQTSILTGLGGKLEKLKTNRRVVCIMYIELYMRIRI